MFIYDRLALVIGYARCCTIKTRLCFCGLMKLGCWQILSEKRNQGNFKSTKRIAVDCYSSAAFVTSHCLHTHVNRSERKISITTASGTFTEEQKNKEYIERKEYFNYVFGFIKSWVSKFQRHVHRRMGFTWINSGKLLTFHEFKYLSLNICQFISDISQF